MEKMMERKPDLSAIDLEHYTFPLDVIVETHGFCNLRCVMCPYPTLKREKGEMRIEVFRKIVDELVSESPQSRLWIAILGEPLLRGDTLIEMLAYARDKGCRHVHLNTNARYLTYAMTQRILECHVEKLFVSLDAFSKTTYDRIRVGGDFDETVRNVIQFLDARKKAGLSRPEVIAQFIVMDENESEGEDFRRFWLDKGAVVKMRLKMGWGEAVASKDLSEHRIERSFPCPWLLRSVSIHWDGKFAQCDADFEGTHSPGDITKQSIRQVWDGELARRRERHWKLDFSFAPCENCRDWSVGRAAFYYPS